ncbi:MAG TPA: Ig-like domain-containing protein [Longimicrobiales bacterium]|nr:Ig-like domain-containing protein [Longimicrobiales bacterium]
MIRRRLFLALAGVVLVAGCDGGDEFGPPSTLTKGPVEGMPTVGTTMAGVKVTVKDADGRAIRGERVLWSADAGGTASPAESVTDGEGVATTAWTLGTVAGAQTFTANVGTLQATFPVMAVADALARFEVDHGGRVLHAIGDTLHLDLIAEDRYGNAAGGVVTWISLDPSIATVQGRVVTAAAEGVARIEVASGTAADTAHVEVDQILAGLLLTPASPRVLAQTETLQLAAVPVDSNGVAMDTALAVAWSTSAAAVASVTQGGLVETGDVGEAVIAASGGSVVGEAALKVKTGPRPAIEAIAPAPIAAGDTITITGTGFSATLALNSVTVAGAAATVQSASATELTAHVAAGSLPCAPTTDVTVLVAVDELEASAQHPLSAARRHALVVGESVTLTGSDVLCNELAESGAYMISVFNATPSPTASSAFRLRGRASGTTTTAASPTISAVVAPGGRARSAAPAAPLTRSTLDRAAETAHARVLEMNLALLERLGRPRPASRGAALRATAVVPTVGQVMALRIPDLDGNACSSYKAVNARVAWVGNHGVILEDTVAPLAGDIDSHWQSIGQEYDALMHQVLLDYFGDPLILDAELDDNQRILMLFSERVNDFESNVAGFVFSGDFYPRSDCASSDGAEIFYGIVPTSAATGYSAGTVGGWKRTMRSTVIHEVKHILSFASRISQAGDGHPYFEHSWLEEATARLAEEFYARAKYGYSQNGNTQYAQSIYCEVRPSGWPECGEGSPYIMAKHYFALLDYYGAVEHLTPIGRTTAGDYTFYGSGWLFVRWALDHAGVAESVFVKALVGEPRLQGVENLAARTGRSYPDLLADFSLALAMDDHGGTDPARAELTFPSWDTRNIFKGLYDDFNDQYPSLVPSEFPLFRRYLNYGDFDIEVTKLTGGTASLFDLSGTPGAQLLELLSSSGGTPPANLGIAVVRFQ